MASTTLPAAHAIAGAAATAGEDVDVGALFREHAPFLLRVVERLTGRGAHVEDIVQEVFIIAHKKRRELRTGDELRGWLYRVASFKAQHHRRSLWRFFRLKDAVRAEPLSQQAPSSHDDVARREQGVRIRSTALSLPFALREVFVLHELEGMETKAVAALLDIPEGTVWSRLSKARGEFKTRWQAPQAPKEAT